MRIAADVLAGAEVTEGMLAALRKAAAKNATKTEERPVAAGYGVPPMPPMGSRLAPPPPSPIAHLFAPGSRRRRLPVAPEDVRRLDDTFVCATIATTIEARTCLARQDQALAAEKAQGRAGPCRACSTGAAIAERVLRVVPSARPSPRLSLIEVARDGDPLVEHARAYCLGDA